MLAGAEMARFKMKKIPPESITKGRDIVSRLKKKHLDAAEKQIEREKERISSGLYDKDYEEAIKQKGREIMRQECTEENPCDGEGQWYHPKAESVCPEDVYTDWYRCPICNLLFDETVPD